ncbi:putative siderophore-dependent iron transporter [Ascodesmis nigricans]|uniref:Putative siderophore-dependent iron transporter n=1 Tax=Ascodesmis nigricans TaxID=341454 RepID=A0A4S2MWG1_9PEZI|nr:putative siderophore-dependent iron transporter [Ascodesmis nigricans]
MSSLLSLFRKPRTPEQNPNSDTGTAAPPGTAAAVTPDSEKQAGVEKIEAVSSAWTKKGLIVAYFGVFLGSTLYALEAMTTFAYIPAATSAFQLHSGLATVAVVTNVLYATVKPPMAKVADAFGRTEAFVVSIILAVLGFVMRAAAKNLSTYAASQVFGAAGQTGVTILIQIFIADTTSLLWRALFSSLPDVPYVGTTWAGPALAEELGAVENWRWGYGMWAIIFPVGFLPLIYSLVVNQQRAKRLNLIPKKTYSGNWFNVTKSAIVDLDILGLILFTAGLIMLLVPLTLGKNWGWSNGRTVSLLIVGIVTLIAFIVIEAVPKLAPKPLMRWSLLKDRTISSACGIGFFYFFVFYLPSPFFYSWLQVVRNLSTKASGNISNIFTLSSCISSVIISLIIRYTGRYKLVMLSGIPIYVLGYGLMIRYRSSSATLGQIIISQIITGVGGGTINVPAQLALQAACNHQDVAVATAMFLTMANVGGAVGSAVSGAVWSNLLPGKLERGLADLPAREDITLIYNSYIAAMGYEWGSEERIAINKAYEEVFRIQLIIACCLSVPILVLGLMMKSIDLNVVNMHNVKGMVVGNMESYGEDGPEGDDSAPRDGRIQEGGTQVVQKSDREGDEMRH